MSITINGVEFQELPYCCYSCKFFLDYGNHTECGYCTLFNKQRPNTANYPSGAPNSSTRLQPSRTARSWS